MPDALYDAEHRLYVRSRDGELQLIVKALSLLPALNTPQEAARLQAAKDILRDRRAHKKH